MSTLGDFRRAVAPDYVVHATIVIIVCVLATIYALVATSYRTDDVANVWIVYGSAIGWAAGRSGSTRGTANARE